MLANSREELVEVFDALDAELDRLDEVSFEVLTAAPTTDSPKKAGSPAKTPTATPNGYHPRTSTTANPE